MKSVGIKLSTLPTDSRMYLNYVLTDRACHESQGTYGMLQAIDMISSVYVQKLRKILKTSQKHHQIYQP